MRLIDADELPITETWALVNSDNNSPSGISFAPLRCILKKDLDNAPTVEYTFEESFQKTVCEQRLYCPKRPQGEWLDIYPSHIAYECSCCGRQMPIADYYKFCPNCGAKMRDKDELNNELNELEEEENDT